MRSGFKILSVVSLIRAARRSAALTGAAGLSIIVLTGCLPEDEIIGMALSPDAKKIAVIYQHKGLSIVNIKDNEITATRKIPLTGSVTWSPDSSAVYYCSDGTATGFSTSANIARYVPEDGETQLITSYPSREDMPFFGKTGLYYRSTESGNSELFRYSDITRKSERIPLNSPTDIVSYATVSGTTESLVYFDFQNLRPRLNHFDPLTSTVKTIVEDSSGLDLVAGPVAVSPDGKSIVYLRNFVPLAADDVSNETYQNNKLFSGKKLVLKSLQHLDQPEKILYENTLGISRPIFRGGSHILCQADGKVVEVSITGETKILPAEFHAAYPLPYRDSQFYFSAADQLLGFADSITTTPKIRIMELQDKMLLAEEYFRIGRSSQSMTLYEEVATDIRRTRDPILTKFLYIANLRRLGNSAEAAKELEVMLNQKEIPEEISEEYLWRTLGLTYYLELNDNKKSSEALEHYEKLTSGTLDEPESDICLNLLSLLKSNDIPLLTTVSLGMKARLDGDFLKTTELFREALRHAPESLPVQNFYLRAIDGFDREAYFYSPTQRPFHYTKAQQLDYYANFVTTAINSPEREEIKLDMFLLKIETNDFPGARELLTDAMNSAKPDQRPEGILDIFRNYLDAPELQTWMDRGMSEVFLHPSIRPRLETMLHRGEDSFLLGLAAMKLALTKNDPDLARKEADFAQSHWNFIIDEEKDSDFNAYYGRLIVMRAREAELRRLYGEAGSIYTQALTFLRDNNVDNFEFQEEIAYRGEMVRYLSADHPDILEKFRDVEEKAGIDVVNPTWDKDVLTNALNSYFKVYDTTTGTIHSLLASECGNVLSKLNRNWHARASYLEASSDFSPNFVRRKAWFELAAIDENLNDPWNAARWYARIADLPFNDPNQRYWFVYQVSRLHISINYKVQAARDALSVILSTRPDTPLAIQCQELLVNTSK